MESATEPGSALPRPLPSGSELPRRQANGEEAVDAMVLHGMNMLMQVRTAETYGELRDRLRAPFRRPEANVPPLFVPKPPLLHAA